MTDDHNPYAPPASAIPTPPAPSPIGPGPLPRVEDDALVVHEESPLPRRCAKCGEKGHAKPNVREFQHVPWWGHLLVGGFAVLIFRRVARIPLPLCGACTDRWTEHQRAFGRAVLGMAAVAVLPFVLFMGADDDARGPLGLLTMLGLAGILVGGMLLRRARLDPFIVRARLVRDRAAWLTGLHPTFVGRAIQPRAARPRSATRERSRADDLTPR